MARVRKLIHGRTQRRKLERLRKREMEPFALELYAVVSEALSRYGLAPSAQRSMFLKAQRSKRFPASSAAHLERMRSLGDLLALWRAEPPFADERGRPKVLAIHGRGAAFESLARRFFPEEGVEAIVALARQYADVGVLPDDRIALHGDIFVSLSDEQAVLAQAVLHVRQVMDTCLYNVTRPPGAPARTERTVAHVLSEPEFLEFQRLIRGQLHEVCEYSDRLLKLGSKRGRAAERAVAGIGIYAFYGGVGTKRRSR